MDLNESFDIYCERTDASFWAEPINAITNIVFIIAALLALMIYRRYLKKGAKRDVHIFILIAIVFIMGIGSFLWHTFATLWANYADVIPIYTFALYYVIIAMLKIMKFNRVQAVITLILIIILNLAFLIFVPSDAFNGSVMYFPFVIMLAGFIIYMQYKKHPAAKYFLIATCVFILALFFRIIDIMCCSWNPIGTHFLWHIFNGVFIYLLLRTLILTQVNEEKYSI